MTQHIRESCGLSFSKLLPTTLYEDNTICITQIKGGYIKCDRRFFYTHDPEENDDITLQQICSKDNLTYLFTKSLPIVTYKKLLHNIGMRQLRDLK